MALDFYDYELSSDAYKARLMLNLLGVEHVMHRIEFYPAREHRSDAYVTISPRGEIPAIRDGMTVLDDAQAILVYLARTYDDERRWYPDDREMIKTLSMWLAFADALGSTAGAARLHDGFLYHHIDISQCRSGAHDLLRALDDHIWFAEEQGYDWLCPIRHATIADIACFPDVMLAEEGGIPLHEFHAVRRWTDRVKALPGFMEMPGICPR